MKNLFALTSRKKFKFIIFIVFVITLPLSGSAEVYKWVDSNGKTNFTDDYSKIPKEFRTEKKIKNSDATPKKTKKTGDIKEEPGVAGEKDKKDQSETDQNKISYKEDENSNILLKVFLNDRVMVNLIMDNSGTSSISPDVAGKLGLNILGLAEKMQTIVRLDSLRIGSVEVKDIRIEVVDQDEDGIIGKDILNEFSYKIDRKKKEINFTDKKNGVSKKPGGHSKKWWEKEFFYARDMLNKAKDAFDEETDPQKKKELFETKKSWEAELKEIKDKASNAGIYLNLQKESLKPKEEEEEKPQADDEKLWKKKYGKFKEEIKDIDDQIEKLNHQKESNPNEFSYQQGGKAITGLEKQKEEVLRKKEDLDSDARRMNIPKNWK